MTTPTLYADGENANSVFNVPSGLGDGPRLVTRTVTVADSASSATTYGVIPFNKGAQVCFGASTLIVPTALDTATLLTWDVGYVYTDNDTTTNINDTDAFVAASTTGRAGGVIEFSAVAGATFVATDDGWITITTGGGSVTTAGTMVLNTVLSYQS